ncbi:MAG TPA: ABC transporter substrate-binding protein [Acidimicrobiales bacterium]|nr:ABC transporter substrate-binding protein [Acidimicrobiales bacterium]
MRAGATLGLTGRYAVQARQAQAGLELWASDSGVDLVVVDDRGSADQAVAAYRALLDDGVDVLLGPYGSGTVRRVAPVVCGTGRVLWNHGGSADDLARHGLATVVAPASTYLHQPVDLAAGAGLEQVVVVSGRGRFAAEVSTGGCERADTRGLRSRLVPVREGHDLAAVAAPEASTRSLASAALIFVGTFDEDVAAVRRVREAGWEVGQLACVAAGIDEFGRRLGDLAEGVVGPAQWWCHDQPASVGPSGPELVRRFQRRFGHPPDYLAAQAAAAGYLATEATARGYGADDLPRWRTDTLLGPFRLDRTWRQTGYTPSAVRWRGGRREPAAGP